MDELAEQIGCSPPNIKKVRNLLKFNYKIILKDFMERTQLCSTFTIWTKCSLHLSTTRAKYMGRCA